jgi:broad specificity phosphatase PhoE
MGDAPRIYLLRHGEVDSKFSGRLVGQLDVALSERGIEQALWWRMRWTSISFARVYCSDLQRSHHTASLIFGGKGTHIESMPQLREICLGKWEGLKVEEIKRSFPGEWEMRGAHFHSYRPAGGESFSDVSARVLPCLEQIVSDLEGNILIVGHAAVNRVILCNVLGMPLGNLLRLGQDYGALNIIQQKGGYFQLRAMNLCPEID